MKLFVISTYSANVNSTVPKIFFEMYYFRSFFDFVNAVLFHPSIAYYVFANQLITVVKLIALIKKFLNTFHKNK